MSLADTLQRRHLPRVVVALSDVRRPARYRAATSRLVGGQGHVRLFFAFDDAYSAVALLELAERLRPRRAELVLEPVVERGIPDDPAVLAKRDYAVVDAARLARRTGLELSRTAPIAAEATAFLAAWVSAVPASAGRDAFCVQAMRQLWLQSDGPVRKADYAELWRGYIGGEPPDPADREGVGRHERRMRRRGLYDTPVAIVGGQWFFAHERLDQIEERLDELGWSAA